MPSALIAERSKVFLKEEAESAIYICNGTAGASCGASPDHAPDVMKILLPPPDSFLGDVFAAFFARASAVVVVVVAAALLPLPLPLSLLLLLLLLLPATTNGLGSSYFRRNANLLMYWPFHFSNIAPLDVVLSHAWAIYLSVENEDAQRKCEQGVLRLSFILYYYRSTLVLTARTGTEPADIFSQLIPAEIPVEEDQIAEVC